MYVQALAVCRPNWYRKDSLHPAETNVRPVQGRLRANVHQFLCANNSQPDAGNRPI